MKKCLFLLLFCAPLVAVAQYDFEQNFVRMDANSLPVVDVLDNFIQTSPSSFLTKTPSFRMNRFNYRRVVDMALVINSEEKSYLDLSSNQLVPQINQRKFGFSFSVGGRNSFDNINTNGGIENIAYKEMKPVFYCAPSRN